MVKQLKGLSLLHHLARIHNIHIITDFRHHTHIVGDQDNRSPLLLTELLHQLKDLRFNGHVQSRCRFIRDHHLRAAHHSHADHNSLAQTAGQLMRIALITLLRLRDSNRTENIKHSLPCFFFGNLLVEQDCLLHLFSHRIYRI